MSPTHSIPGEPDHWWMNVQVHQEEDQLASQKAGDAIQNGLGRRRQYKAEQMNSQKDDGYRYKEDRENV